MLSREISKAVEAAVFKLLGETSSSQANNFSISLERPSKLEHGDYSTSIAMQLARILRKAPMQLVFSIKGSLEQNDVLKGIVRHIEVVSPGYINFFIDWEKWSQASFKLPTASKEKVLIEHTSINPNKSAHIGHLRNACIGDALVRILKRLGYQVEVHNYIDDLGNQLADTVVGILHEQIKGEHTRFGDFCWDVYAKVNQSYSADPDLAEQRTHVLHSLEQGDGNLSWLGMLVAEKIVREHVEEMRKFGIRFDLLVWESNIVREGFWDAANELLKKTPYFVKETEGALAGCWILKPPAVSEEGEAKLGEAEHRYDKVLIRSNGILTYTAKDIAYHLWKFGLIAKDFTYAPFSEGLYTTSKTGGAKPFGRADMVINVIDHRQQYPQMMVKQALEGLGYTNQASKLRHVSYGVVSLSPMSASQLGISITDGKSSYAMSGRQGIGIKISDLLNQMVSVIDQKRTAQDGISSVTVATAAIRYYLLKYHLQTEVIFDMQQAMEINGNSGVYLLYAYARSASVLVKAAQEGLIGGHMDHFPVLEDQEHALLRHIAYWPDTLVQAGNELMPHMICQYAFELAALFNHFYGVCPILKAEEEKKKFRLYLTKQFQITMKDALETLGMPAPEKM